jgi:hypothetical protein
MYVARYVHKCPPCKSIQNYYAVCEGAALALTEVGGHVEGHFLSSPLEVHHYYFIYLTPMRYFQSALVHTEDNGSQWHLSFRKSSDISSTILLRFLDVSMHCNTYHAIPIKLFDQRLMLVRIFISSVYKHIEILVCLACLNKTDYKGLQYYFRIFRTPDSHKCEQCQER